MDQLEYLAKVLGMVRESCTPKPVPEPDTEEDE